MKTKYKNIYYYPNIKQYRFRYSVNGKQYTKCFTGPDAIEKAQKAKSEILPSLNKYIRKKPSINKKSNLPAGICYSEYKHGNTIVKSFQVTAGHLNGKQLKRNICISKNRSYKEALKEAIKIRAEFIKLRKMSYE